MADYYCRDPHLPCILRAWNNYHSFSKYEEPAPDHQNTLDYFYTLTPPDFTTATLPSAYFHIAVQNRWTNRIGCTAMFVVNGTHIYLVRQQSDKRWRRYDWPHTETYDSLITLGQSIYHTLYVILLYPSAHYDRLIGCFQDWVPKPTEFYLEFKRRLMAIVEK